MQYHYLYVAAVNIYQALSISENLSIYRGLSLTLRKATEKLADVSNFNVQLTPISVGGSVGLYKVSCPDNKIQNLIEGVQRYLDKNFQGLTFTVSSTPVSNNFLTDKEVLILSSRRQQLNQTSISLNNALVAVNDDKPSCEFSKLLIGDKAEKIVDKNIVSSTLANVFHNGRKLRQAFYQEEAPSVDLSHLTFTNDLQSISTNPPRNAASLKNKLAYVYLDGNKFSKIQQKLVSTEEEQIEFDSHLRKLRREFLASFLSATKKDPQFFNQQNQFCFETLLWGGDEMLFVMPAWKGFEFIQQFFNCSQNWEVTNKQGNTYPLTHGAGLVFCNQKSSVHTIRTLVNNIADRVKDAVTTKENQVNDIQGITNTYDFMVLESIDNPDDNIEVHNNRLYGPLGSIKSQTFYQSDNNLKVDLTEIADLLVDFPKSQAYKLARLALTEPENLEKAEERIHLVSTFKQTEKLKVLLSQLLWATESITNLTIEQTGLLWILLTEVWDYIAVYQSEKATEGVS